MLGSYIHSCNSISAGILCKSGCLLRDPGSRSSVVRTLVDEAGKLCLRNCLLPLYLVWYCNAVESHLMVMCSGYCVYHCS